MSKDKMKEPKHPKGMEESDMMKAAKKAKTATKPKGKMPKMKKK